MKTKEEQISNHMKLIYLENDYSFAFTYFQNDLLIDGLIDKHGLDLELVVNNIKSIKNDDYFLSRNDLVTHMKCVKNNVIPLIDKKPISISYDHVQGLTILNWHFIKTNYNNMG